MRNFLFNAFEHESIYSANESLNSPDSVFGMEDTMTEWFSPDYLLG